MWCCGAQAHVTTAISQLHICTIQLDRFAVCPFLPLSRSAHRTRAKVQSKNLYDLIARPVTFAYQTSFVCISFCFFFCLLWAVCCLYDVLWFDIYFLVVRALPELDVWVQCAPWAITGDQQWHTHTHTYSLCIWVWSVACTSMKRLFEHTLHKISICSKPIFIHSITNHLLTISLSQHFVVHSVGRLFLSNSNYSENWQEFEHTHAHTQTICSFSVSICHLLHVVCHRQQILCNLFKMIFLFCTRRLRRPSSSSSSVLA